MDKSNQGEHGQTDLQEALERLRVAKSKRDALEKAEEQERRNVQARSLQNRIMGEKDD